VSADLFSNYLLPSILAIIMFGMGSSLEVEDFQRLAHQPKEIFTGLVGQMVLLPALAFVLAALSALPPFVKAGMVLIASCPGGTSANLVNYLLKGKLELSISLTAVNSLLILITVPLLVRLGLVLFVGEDTTITLPFGNTVLNIFITTLLPVSIGVLFRRKYRETADRLQKIFKWLLPTLLALAFAGVLFLGEGKNEIPWQEFWQLFPYALALNIGAMLMAYYFSRMLLSNAKSWYTIAIAVGLQNSGLALFVAETLLKNRQMALIAIVYGSFTFFSTTFIGWVLKKTSKRAYSAG
jgi:BASS family bile acid:Na+ symporter